MLGADVPAPNSLCNIMRSDAVPLVAAQRKQSKSPAYIAQFMEYPMKQFTAFHFDVSSLLTSLRNTIEDFSPDRESSSVRVKESRLQRVLILEYRDDVFSSLESLFNSNGVRVTRAESATALAERAVGFGADLIVINADSPGESGWLMCAKIRLQRQQQSLWIYAANGLQCPEKWADLSGANQIIVHGGVLADLNAEIQVRLENSPLSLTLEDTCVFELASL